jgi:hypothetical protein
MEARWKRKRPLSDPPPAVQANGRPDISAGIAIRPRRAAPRAHLSRRRSGFESSRGYAAIADDADLSSVVGDQRVVL